MKNKPGPDVFGGKEGEKGFGAQLLGGAAGGFLGHSLGGGMIETLGGAVVGALGAKVIESEHDKYQSKKDRKLAAAPFKDQAMAGSAYSGSRSDRRSRRRSSRRRSEGDYSSDYSRSPPPRRRSTSRR